MSVDLKIKPNGHFFLNVNQYFLLGGGGGVMRRKWVDTVFIFRMNGGGGQEYRSCWTWKEEEVTSFNHMHQKLQRRESVKTNKYKAILQMKNVTL